MLIAGAQAKRVVKITLHHPTYGDNTILWLRSAVGTIAKEVWMRADRKGLHLPLDLPPQFFLRCGDIIDLSPQPKPGLGRLGQFGLPTA